MNRPRWLLPAFGGWLISGCGAHPSVPEQPTWADVQPILRANCAGCHGSTAGETGLGYRLDFYDMLPSACGEAAAAIPAGGALAAAYAAAIATDITPPGCGVRERMPPLPGSSLESWDRATLLNWTTEPIKGAPPEGNRPPTVRVFGLPSQVTDRLEFTALVDDPDGDEAVGVIKLGSSVTFAMNRSGSFTAAVDLASAPAGRYPITAVTCDGWTSSSFDLGWVQIKH